VEQSFGASNKSSSIDWGVVIRSFISFEVFSSFLLLPQVGWGIVFQSEAGAMCGDKASLPSCGLEAGQNRTLQRKVPASLLLLQLVYYRQLVPSITKVLRRKL
jgi:hypothetical protein